jgi:pyruvate,orthophosphate dikinase
MARFPAKQPFVRDIADPAVSDASRYGGKASGLSRMMSAGVPVPPAFVIGAEGFHHFRANGDRIGSEIMDEVRKALRRLESATDRSFGGVNRPLLVSVRSGAAISMPGMMDTVLNLGLTAPSAFAIAGSRGTRFALDTWLRFWRMFFDTVLGLDPSDLVDAARDAERQAQASPSPETFEALQGAILAHADAEGESVGADPTDQLELAIAAVFRSWDSARAKAYRRHHGISDDLGTAVTIQAMVFGNADENSGSGVAFTRNPNDGEKSLYGEYLIGRQGEDLVSGTQSPIDLSDPTGMNAELRSALMEIGARLEGLYRDAVDIEFTVESGRLYMLQVRPAKKTAAAAIRIAADLIAEEVIAPREALSRIATDQIRRLSRPSFDEEKLIGAPILAQGLGSSPGHAHGSAILDSDRAADAAAKGEDVILLRPITSPKDIRGMLSANGIVTATGGALSHAAVVSRALDKPCIVGCETISIDPQARTFTIGARVFREGDEISIDGASGRIYSGSIKLRTGGSSRASLDRLLAIADQESGCAVWAAPRSAAEAKDRASGSAPGLGVIRLTDLIISQGAIDPFVQLISRLGDSAPPHSVHAEIAALVREACRPLLADNLLTPVHIRLSRISSDRARRLIENWTEMPPDLFLPLGSHIYLRSILKGIAEAAQDVSHANVTPLIGGVVNSREVLSFSQLTSEVGLDAGTIVQNAAALTYAGEIASRCKAIWIDAGEIVRTAYGFPSEVLHAAKTLDDYAAAGFIDVNPFARPASFLVDRLRSAADLTDANATATIGVDLSAGFSSVLASELRQMGFRQFAASPVHRDELRLILAQPRKE